MDKNKKICYGDFEKKRLSITKYPDGTANIELDGETLIDTTSLFDDGTIIIDGLRMEYTGKTTSGCGTFRENAMKDLHYRFNFKKDNQRKDRRIKRLLEKVKRIEATKHLIKKAKVSPSQKTDSEVKHG